MSSPAPLLGVLETSLYCPDLEAAEAFYGEVLGLECLGRRERRHVFFRSGDGVLLLFDPEHTARVSTEVAGVPIPLHGSRGAGHVAFRIAPGELASWREHLVREGVPIEAEVQWPGGGRSVYFRDPAGNSLELATPEVWGFT